MSVPQRWLLLSLLLMLPSAAPAAESKLEFGRFGAVTLYAGSDHPAHVVLFVSGDGGWNLGVVAMARELAKLDSLVVGIDIRGYLRKLDQSEPSCSYPAADFEALSQFVQKKLQYTSYIAPVLIGYSSGATLVYAVLAQAPPSTFRGGVSLGFCPDLLLKKSLCRGSGIESRPGAKGKGLVFLPTAHLQVPWIALQGKVDQVCNPPATQAFVGKVPHGEVVMLEKVGHGYAVPRNWMPQFKQAYLRVLESKPAEPPPVRIEELADLPLIELPAEKSADTFAIWITGDGGWGVTDQGVSQELVRHGIPVVAINSLHYFWTRRTPEEAAAALARVIRYYQATWRKNRVLLIGYSFGADVLPFLVNRLPADVSAHVTQVGLLGLSREADFEVHMLDWFTSIKRDTSLPIAPEIAKLKGKDVYCFYGEDDSDTACKDLPAGLAKLFSRAGGHRFGRDYQWIADAILKGL